MVQAQESHFTIKSYTRPTFSGVAGTNRTDLTAYFKNQEKSKSLTLLVTWCAYCCSNIRVCLRTTSETCSTCNPPEISAQCQTRSRIIYNRETVRCRCHTRISVLAHKRPYSYKSQGIGLQHVTCSRKSLFSLLQKRQIKSLMSCSQLVIVNSCWLSATSSF